jgi:hypothetical protein
VLRRRLNAIVDPFLVPLNAIVDPFLVPRASVGALEAHAKEGGGGK